MSVPTKNYLVTLESKNFFKKNAFKNSFQNSALKIIEEIFVKRGSIKEEESEEQTRQKEEKEKKPKQSESREGLEKAVRRDNDNKKDVKWKREVQKGKSQRKKQ